MINALIEADRVELLAGPVDIVDTPSCSGAGQRIAPWSHYSSPLVSFVRVGTLDAPDAFPPGIRIFTPSRQPWVRLSGDLLVMPEYYDSAQVWPAASLERRRALSHRNSG